MRYFGVHVYTVLMRSCMHTYIHTYKTQPSLHAYNIHKHIHTHIHTTLLPGSHSHRHMYFNVTCRHIHAHIHPPAGPAIAEALPTQQASTLFHPRQIAVHYPSPRAILPKPISSSTPSHQPIQKNRAITQKNRELV